MRPLLVVAWRAPGPSEVEKGRRSADPLESGIGGGQVELGRVEVPTDPFEIAIVLLVLGSSAWSWYGLFSDTLHLCLFN